MTKELAKTIFTDVIQTFGYINNPTKVDACYILRNGQFLDTQGSFSTHQHINIAKYISKTYNINDINTLNNGSNFMMNVCGAIKITCWNGGQGIKGIYLPKFELTSTQYDALELFIAFIGKNVTEDWPLWVATYNEGQQIEYTKPFKLAERVIADIEHFYYSGKLELTESLKEAVDTDYSIPANFNLVPLNKANSSLFKNKGGLYLIVGAKVVNGKLQVPSSKLSFEEIKDNWPHYVGQAEDIASRLNEHLNSGVKGITTSEENSKLHLYMHDLYNWAQKAYLEDDEYSFFEKAFKFYALELIETAEIKKEVSKVEVPDFSNKFNIKDIVEDKISETFLTDLLNARTIYANSINKTEGKALLNNAEYTWVNKFGFDRSKYIADLQNTVLLNSQEGGVHWQRDRSKRDPEYDRKIVRAIILLNYTLYSMTLIGNLVDIKTSDVLNDLNNINNHEFYCKALINKSNVKIRPVTQYKELSSPIAVTVENILNSEVLYNKIVLPTYDAARAFCGLVFTKYNFNAVNAKPNFGSMGLKAVIEKTIICDEDQKYKIYFSYAENSLTDSYNNYKNFLLDPEGYKDNQFDYAENDDTSAESLKAVEDSLIEDYQNIQKMENNIAPKWNAKNLETLRHCYVDQNMTDQEIADNSEELFGIRHSRENIKNARMHKKIHREEVNLGTIIKQALKELNIPAFTMESKDKVFGYIRANYPEFISNFQKHWKQNLNKTQEALLEDTRNTLVTKSRSIGEYKNQERGKNRFERKRYSQIAKTVKQYNQIDMNKFFKEDLLIVHIPVVGETDSYTVSIKMDGVVAEIAKNIKNNKNRLEYRTIIQALTKVFNTANIFVKCTCDDYKYRFAHWNIVNNVSVDDTASDPGPGRGIRNPNDDKGRGCKHVLLVLANGDWLIKVASVINNYIHYAEEKLQKPFLKVIFPKLYGIPADEMVEQDLIDDDKYLDSSAGLIDAINEYGKTRGRYQSGSNKNPVTGTGGRSKATINQEKDTEKVNKDNEEPND